MIERIAFIGTRGHQGQVLRELPELPQQRIVAISDGGDSADGILKWLREQNRPDAPQHFGHDWQRLLDEAKPDAVVVAGPFEMQATMAAGAIERGVHVLVEKPAALTFDDLARLRAAHVKRPDVHLASMLFSRYDPGFYTAAKLIRDGAIGDVRLVESRKSYRLGKRPAYYANRATYGGTIPWVGSHAIDWIAWMTDKPFESVYAAHSHAGNPPEIGTMERSALCHFRLQGECFASAAIDVRRPPTAPSHGDDWIRLVGTTGVIEARTQKVRLINATAEGTQEIDATCDRKPWRDFCDHVAGVRSAIVDAKVTLQLADAVLRARQSADEGHVVTFQA